MFLLSSIAIPLFYAAGLMYGQRSKLVTAEYWRWWVVHLWVEGFFEVFATVVIAFLFTRLKLLSVRTATRAVLFSTVVFLSGGIIGTFHHLYFAGNAELVLALGAVFSALEVVPLVLIGFEAWENIRLARSRQQHIWVAAYKWPIYFFVAVAFWNFVGAGLVRFPHQSAGRALLHAGTEHDSGARPHGAVRRVRHARAGADAVLPARSAAGQGLEERAAVVRVLGDQHRAGADGADQHAAHRTDAGLGLGEYGTWYARSAEFLHSRAHEPTALDAHDRRQRSSPWARWCWAGSFWAW